MNFVRRKVSLKKRRYQENGYDLDLSYITDRVVAMGFPSQGVEGLYRNPLSQVRKFLDWKHEHHYKIYNLCIEREYDVAKFASRVARYPFADHQAPPLHLIPEFCADVDAWLGKDPKNIAAVHCKAGKGRAGMMVCCYLVHSDVKPTALEAMEYFAEKRTHDGEGVTIPSQRRYVCYYELVKKHGYPQFPTIKLDSIEVSTTKYVKLSNDSAPYCKVFQNGKEIFSSAPVKAEKGVNVVLDCKDTQVAGDFKVYLFDKSQTKGKEKEIAHFYLNSAFIEGNQVILKKKEIDKLVSDKKHKKYSPDFELVIKFKDAEQSAFTKGNIEMQEKDIKINGKEEDDIEKDVEVPDSMAVCTPIDNNNASDDEESSSSSSGEEEK